MLSILSVILLSCILSSYAQTLNLNSYWCSSCDDPHLRTFDQLAYDFMFIGDNYIMYTNYLDMKVTAAFQKCNPRPSSRATCNCGVHVSYKTGLIYIDTCGAIPVNGMNFYYSTAPNYASTKVMCSSKIIPPGKETDDTWWNTAGNAVKVPGNEFLCARTKNSASLYYIRTNSPDNTKNIYVKIQTTSAGIQCFYIRPSQKAFGGSSITGGLCGNFNKNTTDDRFVWTCNGTSDGSINSGCIPTPGNQTNFWKLDTCVPPQLDYKLLDGSFCVCDPRPTTTTTLQNCTICTGKCKTSLAQCGASASNTTLPPTNSTSTKPTNPTNSTTAQDKCDKAFIVAKLDLALKRGNLTQQEYDECKINCITDYIDTGDDTFIINTIETCRIKVIEECGDNITDPLCQEFINTPTICALPGFDATPPNGVPIPPCPRPGCPAK